MKPEEHRRQYARQFKYDLLVNLAILFLGIPFGIVLVVAIVGAFS